MTSYSSVVRLGRKRRREGWFDRDDRLMNGGEEKRNAKKRAAQKYGPNNAACETRCKCGKCVFNHLGSAGTHDEAMNNFKRLKVEHPTHDCNSSTFCCNCRPEEWADSTDASNSASE